MDGFLPVSAGTLLSFSLASFLIELTPGPNMTYLALVAAQEGRRPGYATVAGVSLGLAVIGFAAAFGVAEIVQASPLLYEALRWAGVAFLLYLAWDGWRGGVDVVAETVRPAAREKYFARGLITNLLNPKAAVFYVAVLSTFLEAGHPPLAQTLTLTTTYVVVATLVHVLIVTLAGALEPLLNNARRERLARRVLSGMLALVALWFGWSTAR
ncbi:LysE family translocator [Nitratireductor sp. StC3]|uniref:LysE family translocator n=1 Tax=Nitratireductor sp. StC3 TaxID=2126741 RepID=UPI000D0DCCFA|nr:LysE family translocator [Nitratireductor sp. StC3]PSM19438.1 lysine transporter LysE [Nitratireductor sp. StC3]